MESTARARRNDDVRASRVHRRIRRHGSEVVDGLRPVVLEQPRQRAVGEQLAAGLAASRSSWSRSRRRRCAAPARRRRGRACCSGRAPPSLRGTPSPSREIPRRPRRAGCRVHAASVSRVALCSRALSSSVSERVSFSGESCAACRISSEYALPMPLKRCGSVSARLSVWFSRVSAARKCLEASSRSGRCRPDRAPRSAASPRTSVSDARLRVPASVKIERAGRETRRSRARPAASSSRPAPRQCRRPAIMRWITAKSSSPRSSTMRLPMRRTPSTVRPDDRIERRIEAAQHERARRRCTRSSALADDLRSRASR